MPLITEISTIIFSITQQIPGNTFLIITCELHRATFCNNYIYNSNHVSVSYISIHKLLIYTVNIWQLDSSVTKPSRHGPDLTTESLVKFETFGHVNKSQIGCALALVNFSFCQSSGPMVQHYCHGIRLPQFLFLFLIPGRVGFWPIFKKKQTRFGNKTPSFFIVFSPSELQVKIF